MVIIKSQYGNIIPINTPYYISIEDEKIYANSLENPDFAWIRLGTYESEERAKEVMEEIENHIRECYVLNNLDFRVNDFTNKQDKLNAYKEMRKGAIYTMPEK